MSKQLAVFLLILFSAFANALAEPAVSAIRTSIISDRRAVAAEETFTVGVRFVMDPGWHIYWRNPGDSGIPTEVKWVVPAGVEVSPINWPAPDKMPLPELMCYGYGNEVVLFSEFKISSDYYPKDLPISAEVKWLGCEKLCVPGKSTVALNLLIQKSSEKNLEGERLIEQYRKKVPDKASIRGTAIVDDAVITLRYTGQEGSPVYFYPIADNLLVHLADQTVSPFDNGIQIELKRSYAKEIPDQIHGVLAFADRSYEAVFEVQKKINEKSLNSGIITPLIITVIAGVILIFLVKKSPRQ